MRPTHVEFEDENKFTHIVRVGSFGLHRNPGGQWHVVAEAAIDAPGEDDPGWPISPETAARLRRALLGEPEAAAPPEPAPPVVTGPGVYRDKCEWGWRVVGRGEDGRWYGESPDGKRSITTWDDAGTADTGADNALVVRVADLSTWRLDHDENAAFPDELAAMLAAPVPAAEPEFVAVRLGMFAPNGICTTTYPLADRELAERSCAYNGSGWSVAPLYIRREGARP